MDLLLRSKWFLVLLAVLIWLAGTWGIWRSLPYQPRSQWQPPDGVKPLGFLSDSRTIVTAYGAQYPVQPPVQLWDVDTGRLRNSHFQPGDWVGGATGVMQGGHDYIQISHLKPSRNLANLAHVFRLFDVWSGKELIWHTAFLDSIASEWRISPDGQTSAVATKTEETGNQIEWHDIESKQLLKRLENCTGPMTFSSDGRRFAAIRPKNFGRDFSIVVWDVPSGREVAALPSRESGHRPRAFELSAKGTHLFASSSGVWDIELENLRFPSTSPLNFATFLADGRTLVRQVDTIEPNSTKGICMLQWLNIPSGTVVKQLPLANPRDTGNVITKANIDGHFLLCNYGRDADWIFPWLAGHAWTPAMIKSASWFQRRLQASQHFLLIDTDTGKEVFGGAMYGHACTPDGKILLTTDQNGHFYFWDIPPRYPWPWLLCLTAVLALMEALFLRRHFRRQHQRTLKSVPIQ